MSGLDACWSVFDHQAIGGLHSQHPGSGEIWLGIGLAFDYVFRRNHDSRNRKIGIFQPAGRKIAGAGGDDAPAALRNRLEQFDCAWHDHDSGLILRFHFFQPDHFGFGIEMRRQLAHYVNGPNSVGKVFHGSRIETDFVSPQAILAGNRRRGINQNSVEVEEDG